MTKLICAIGALAVASFGFAACTTSTDNDLGNDGGAGSETSTGNDGSTKTDGTTPTTDAGDGGSCKLVGTSGDKTCDTCVEGSCCAIANSCVNDAECLALYTCIGACPAAGDGGADAGTVACVADCADVHPNGKAGVKALEDCVDAHCSKECQ